jgi:hypothetical protein
MSIQGTDWIQNKYQPSAQSKRLLHSDPSSAHDITNTVKRQNYPCNRPWRPIGLWNVEAHTLSLDNQLIFYEAESTPGS